MTSKATVKKREGGASEGDASAQIRVGGVALGNGIIFYSPGNWAAAVRRDDGSIAVDCGGRGDVSAALSGPLRKSPIARLISLSQSMTLLPFVKLRVPEARLPFSLGSVFASFGVAALGSWLVRRPGSKLPPIVQELLSAIFALLPALLVVRGTSSARYHGAEHKAVAALQTQGMSRISPQAVKSSPREHPRCGTNLAGVLLVTATLSNWLLRKLSRGVNPALKVAADIASLSAALEIFNWASRNPGNPVARGITGLGLGIQHYLTTEEPGPDELEVSYSALQALMEREKASPSLNLETAS